MWKAIRILAKMRPKSHSISNLNIPLSVQLAAHAGSWVGVKNGNLVVVANTAHELVNKLQRMAPYSQGTTCWWQRPEDEKSGPKVRFIGDDEIL